MLLDVVYLYLDTFCVQTLPLTILSVSTTRAWPHLLAPARRRRRIEMRAATSSSIGSVNTITW